MNAEQLQQLVDLLDQIYTALWAIEDKLNAQLKLAEKKEQEDHQIPLL